MQPAQAQQPQLPAPELTETEVLKLRIEELERELADARTDYETERAQRIMSLKNAPEVKKLYRMLCLLFDGQGSQVGISVATGVSQPIPSEAYSAWKQRLPPSCGRVIDALLVQPMGYNQLKNFCKMGQSTLDGALAKLRANGLIEKDGNLNRLKGQ